MSRRGQETAPSTTYLGRKVLPVPGAGLNAAALAPNAGLVRGRERMPRMLGEGPEGSENSLAQNGSQEEVVVEAMEEGEPDIGGW